ncbi:hypothetical protein [Nocardia sp. NPDC049526]|uniref:hypothetical protein n=1 Tax=Nocardia sp. NPDC049526 TaxID=3364316 RepID=UPI0037B51A22
MWGSGFALDAVVRVVLAYTLPVDSVALVSTLRWLVVLGALRLPLRLRHRKGLSRRRNLG